MRLSRYSGLLDICGWRLPGCFSRVLRLRGDSVLSFNTVQVKTKGTNVETRRQQKEQHTCHVCNIRCVWEGQRKANLIAVTALTDTQLKLPVLGSALPQEEVLKCRKQPHNAPAGARCMAEGPARRQEKRSRQRIVLLMTNAGRAGRRNARKYWRREP